MVAALQLPVQVPASAENVASYYVHPVAYLPAVGLVAQPALAFVQTLAAAAASAATAPMSALRTWLAAWLAGTIERQDGPNILGQTLFDEAEELDKGRAVAPDQASQPSSIRL